MYSVKIKTKVDAIFASLRERSNEIINDSTSTKQAIEGVSKLVSSELASRSKSILSDMLFDLSDSLMDTEFYSDIRRQNRFSEINLRQEIIEKYRFSPSTTIDFNEASRELKALGVGIGVFAAGAVGEIGIALVKGLKLKSLVPVPIALLVVASLGAALLDYKCGNSQNKHTFAVAMDDYFTETEKQLLSWFDSVEEYFNKRSKEIEREISNEGNE